MFTGIIEEIGQIDNISSSFSGLDIRIRASKVLTGLKKGDSVSLNGVCLTVKAVGSGHFQCDAVHETLSRSVMRNLKVLQAVNLERAVIFGGKLDGHFVSGHVDCSGKIVNISYRGTSRDLEISLEDRHVRRFIAEKGSIAIDGVSLTVAAVFGQRFRVALVPYSIANTTLGQKRMGDEVNIEADIFAKYVVEQFERAYSKKPAITEEFLREAGFPA